MSIYCIGDLHGCDSALQELLDLIDYSPSRDMVYFLGDLVNRGPSSLKTLRRLARADGSMLAILGNHDLHLLALYHHARKAGRRDTLDKILKADDCAELIDWLRNQPLARLIDIAGKPLLLVHAGVLPAWTAQQTIRLAQEVEAVLQSDKLPEFIQEMYGNEPAYWSEQWVGVDRLRVIVNALTRIRFCTAEGVMDFLSAESSENAPEGLMPWFDVPERRSLDTKIIFGHWSTLGLKNRANILSLDTGCVWGGSLSALRFGDSPDEHELIQVKCEQAQKPG